MRVLLLAEAANPELSSVPLLGWYHTQAIARHVDAHVVTQVRNESAWRRAGIPEDHFTAIDSEALARPLYRASKVLGEGRAWSVRTALKLPSYLWFERLVWRQFADRLKSGEFDLVHRVTPVSPAMASPIAIRLQAIGVPFVIGPLNGGLPWPAGFDDVRRAEGERQIPFKRLYSVAPMVQRSLRAATVVVVGSRHTRAALSAELGAKSAYLPENGIDASQFERAEAPPGLACTIVFVGRLVPCKCVDVLIEAAAPVLKNGDARLTIIGDGPERAKLERLSDELGVAARTEFTGWLKHAEVAERLRDAEILGFPSIRDFGGGAVLEAMAAGIVPIVVDYGGPAELVTPESGIRVPLAPKRQLVYGFRKAIDQLVASSECRTRLAAGAAERARRLYDWDAKAVQMLQVYRWALGRGERPDLEASFGITSQTSAPTEAPSHGPSPLPSQ